MADEGSVGCPNAFCKSESRAMMPTKIPMIRYTLKKGSPNKAAVHLALTVDQLMPAEVIVDVRRTLINGDGFLAGSKPAQFE